MRRNTRTVRITQSELDAQALNSKHPKQAAEAAKMMDANWLVYKTTTDLESGAMVVMLRHPAGTFGVMYPNGRFLRQQVGKKTVSFNWADVRAAATM
jgi:hypothetical protein